MNLFNYINSNLAKLKTNKFDILYVYSDFRELGKYKPSSLSKRDFLQQVVQVLLQNIGTLIVPTFTYTTSGIFDVKSTPTRLGAMNAHFLEESSVARSEHPLFSFASIGAHSKLIKNIGKSAFGNDSIFERLLSNNVAFLYIGRPVRLGNTMIHYVEQLNNASYRYEKSFSTNVYENKRFIGSNYSAFVRKRDNLKNNYEFSFEKAAQELVQKKLVKEVHITNDFSNLSLISYDDLFEELNNLININMSIFLKHPL